MARVFWANYRAKWIKNKKQSRITFDTLYYPTNIFRGKKETEQLNNRPLIPATEWTYSFIIRTDQNGARQRQSWNKKWFLIGKGLSHENITTWNDKRTLQRFFIIQYHIYWLAVFLYCPYCSTMSFYVISPSLHFHHPGKKGRKQKGKLSHRLQISLKIISILAFLWDFCFIQQGIPRFRVFRHSVLRIFHHSTALLFHRSVSQSIINPKSLLASQI